MSYAKRLRLSTGTQTRIFTRQSNVTRTHTLDTLPPEVLEMILRLLPLHDVASSVRLVSRQCSIVATSVLNGVFYGAGVRLEAIMSHIESTMPKVATETDLLACSKAFNALELIRAQYRMLRAVTWRYIHPPTREKFPKLCFYAGILLDDLNNLLRLARVKPSALTGSHGPDSCVVCFISLCKRFMNYFEKVSERKVNRSALISGCKAVDVLDCLAEGREVVAFRTSTGRGNRGGIINMRLKYVMRRAWFTCLEVPSAPDENSWRDEQRFMYLRLRRLVGSVNEHLFEKTHYERELLLQTPTIPSPRPPPASTYSGYGEYGGQFFYYGNMNKYAYESKFKFTSVDEPEEDRETETIHGAPCFDLVFFVVLRCSPELAPLAIRSSLKSDDLESPTTNHQQELYLKVDVTCPASVANRLPGHFSWELRSPRRGHRSF
ncbi:uncharacterized protein LOC107268206 [Cephus cinctus]|uniref:Uncharacterized protein LOC107268206 n=1 Tax=Cephus cinctus TaxID=211228 RepID=A0AAJ7BWU0_CEPCN|nr:uncharacterized protein LOC107268206 [Cephus cinctus]